MMGDAVADMHLARGTRATTRVLRGDDMPEETPPAGETEPIETTQTIEEPARPRPDMLTSVRVVVAAALVGAAVIHFAYAPVHLEENTVHGVFFLALGWAQLGLAFALYRWREARWPWSAIALVNAGVIALWLVTRTAGLPGSEPEPWGFPDGLASGLEAVAVLGSLLALRPALASRPAPRINPVFAGVGALALMGLVSASVTPSIAGEHGHDEAATAGDPGHDMSAMAPGETMPSGDGHDHGDGAAASAPAVDRSDRCDLGFNTASYNDAAQPGSPAAHPEGGEVGFTIEDWAKVFVDPASGDSPDVIAAGINANPGFKETILNGTMTHTLDPEPWNPLTSQAQCDKLADELEQARAVIERYPTVADGEAAGYKRIAPYVPGIASHYINVGYLRDGFNIEQPEMLLYDGTDPTSHIVGLSYYIFQETDEEPTEGFTGDNDHYHRHFGLCLREGQVIGGNNTSPEECAARGGGTLDGSGGWMSHVWLVPGCESDWGVFSGANPALKIHPRGGPPAVQGCGTGKTLADPLNLDDAGDGPTLTAARAG
jgi:hypothetical protein